MSEGKKELSYSGVLAQYQDYARQHEGKGSTRQVAKLLGVSDRTVRRYMAEGETGRQLMEANRQKTRTKTD